MALASSEPLQGPGVETAGSEGQFNIGKTWEDRVCVNRVITVHCIGPFCFRKLVKWQSNLSNLSC